MEQVTQPLTPLDPQQIGNWQIDSRIGAGGMGVVYRSHAGGRTAAIKVVRPGLLDDPAVVARFAREVAVLRRVRDVHISEFLDADLAGHPAWMATEYVPGPNLRRDVELNGPLDVTQWWRLAEGLAQALAVLDVHGITHRDIKPANVILSDRGPVLIDFGIAHAEHLTSVTATGLLTGSPAWLSPEQVEMIETGPASDVFSLGSLLAYAATGRAPFGQGAAVVVLTNIQTAAPDLAGVDRQRGALLKRMMDKDPTRRPPIREVLELARDRQSADTTQPIPVKELPTRVMSAPEPVLTAPRSVRAAAGDTPTAQPGWEPPMSVVTLAASPPVPPPAVVRAGGSHTPRRGRGPVFVALAFVVAALLGYFALQSVTGDPGDSGGSAPSTSVTAPPADTTPPISDELRSGDWLLAQYTISQSGGKLVIEGVMQNQSEGAASTDATVNVYVGGQLVAQATGSTGRVPAGGGSTVVFTSDDDWVPGQPVVQLVTP